MKKSIHILLADDDQDDRFLFEEALKQVSIPTHFTAVEDGQKLMDLLTRSGVELPDVIFLDLNMPRKNGSECLSRIKRNKELKQIPVIIYSTSLYDEVADVLYKKGAHYYLKKCNSLELPGAIKRVISLLKRDNKQPSRSKFVVNTQEKLLI